MQLIERVRAVLATEPDVQAEALAERWGLSLSSVGPALRTARYWTPERRAEASRRSKARAVPEADALVETQVYRAVRDGRLVRPDTCSACERPAKVHGHHQDYSKPLDVIWLCPQCHWVADRLRHIGEPYDARIVRIVGRIKTNKLWKARERM